MEYKKDKLLAEGKTKRVWSTQDSSSDVLIENKNAITAHDDPDFTKSFDTKAIHSTTTTCCVFDLLKKAKIPVAYEDQISPTEFVAKLCTMVPLEIVVRRYAAGSYLKRHPELKQEKILYRFDRLEVEFFLKTTRGKLKNSTGSTVLTGLDPSKGEEDPLILDPHSDSWELFHSKKPVWDKGALLNKTVRNFDVLNQEPMMDTEAMDRITREIFLVLEGAWNSLGFHFIDMKIEFGIDPSGRLVVADVIDNDSWRLKNSDWEELSKQVFREGGRLEKIEENYRFVASLTQQFRIPEQAIILWRGSSKDRLPQIKKHWRENVTFQETVLSGHKSTKTCIQELREHMSNYPDGGVIIAIVGRSNGLAPMLATHTTWPVIAAPTTIEDFPDDIWSSIRMPSSVPVITAWPAENAVEAALNILSNKNPAIYMQRVMEMEKLDI